VRLVVGRADDGEKFLKAEPDGEIPALLLQLPSIFAGQNSTTIPMTNELAPVSRDNIPRWLTKA